MHRPKLMKQSIILFLLILLPNLSTAEDARNIMQQVIDRDDGKSQYSRQTIATCKYEIKNKKLRCVNKPRIKVVEAVQKDRGKNGKDSQSISIIKKPAAERGIGFLQYDYYDVSKDTEQWMYLSAMGKIKRIVAGNDNEPKTGTLFGSEFSYEDTERPHLDDYTYKLVKEDTYRKRDCWVIESQPTPKHARKSNYRRSLMWIDKKRMMMIKGQFYDRRGRLNKQLVMSKIKKVDGVWVAQQLNMTNIQSKRITTMKMNDIVLNINVNDALLTKRTLTDGAFREQQLNTIRTN